jgi:ABC-type uncharacterized transport system permease subunit
MYQKKMFAKKSIDIENAVIKRKLKLAVASVWSLSVLDKTTILIKMIMAKITIRMMKRVLARSQKPLVSMKYSDLKETSASLPVWVYPRMSLVLFSS